MLKKIMTTMMMLTLILSSCTSYKSQYISFRPPEAYPNKQLVEGISIGAEAYAVREVAKDAFGFDIIETGLLPVQLVIQNQNGSGLKIVAEQTFLVDAEGRYWQVVPNHVAVDRVEKSTQLAALGKGAGTGALFGAAGGAVLGAALGIVSGSNVGSAMGKGAALGAVGGAAIGTAREAGSNDRQNSIVSDLRSKGLEGKVIPNENLANGFIFFPAEAKSAKALKLQIKEIDTGRIHSISLYL